MPENKTEVQLKAKATNWLLSALIAVVSWIGKREYDALQQISEDLKNVGGTVQVHTSEINTLKNTTSELNGKVDQVLLMQYDKQPAKHEDFFELKKNNR